MFFFRGRVTKVISITLVLVIGLWFVFTHGVNNPLFIQIYDSLGLKLISMNPISVLASDSDPILQPKDRELIRSGDIKVMTAKEACMAISSMKPIDKSRLLLVANTPSDFAGLNPNQQQQFVLESTKAAIQLGAKVVVDCSCADLARLTPKGLISLNLLREQGVIRSVIFDGGHHLPSLVLNPDILITPVLRDSTGKMIISHGYVRDSLPLDTLLELRRQLKLTSLVAICPRPTTVAKTKNTMAKLTLTALINTKPAPRKKTIVNSLNYQVIPSSRPITISNSIALAAMPIGNFKPQQLAEIQTKFHPSKVYLALLYGNMSDTNNLSLLKKNLGHNGLNLNLVTSPYNTLDLLINRYNIFKPSGRHNKVDYGERR